MIRAFAFDLDETLTDCERQHERATRAMLEAAGVDPKAARDAFHDVTGRRTRDIVEDWRAASGASHSVDELLALRHAAFLAALDDDPPLPLPGALELVRECARRGPVAVVTSGHREDALAALGALGVMPLLSTIVTGEDVAQPKPDPEPYVVAAGRLGVKPAQLLVFEDSARGVAAGLAAGCQVVAVPNRRTTDPKRVAGARLVLASLVEALPLDALLERLP